MSRHALSHGINTVSSVLSLAVAARRGSGMPILKATENKNMNCPECLFHRGKMVALVECRGWVGSEVKDLLVCESCDYEHIENPTSESR